MERTWDWVTTHSGRPGMSGDLAKLFRHEEPKTPGIFALDPPSAPATLLAREVIQNSWDAARDLQSWDEHVPQFQIEFRFQEIEGDAKTALVDSLGLRDLAGRVKEIDREAIGLRAEDCLSTIEGAEPIRILKISEKAASGMYGPWTQNKSHMYLALLSVGFTDKLDGAGGSYGYGKAGLINGSRIRSVLAYSCFREREDDPGVTRRLLGVTYWGSHDVGGNNHQGIGTLSAGSPGDIRPFENDAADEIAREIGIEVRDSARDDDLGTTFLVIDSPIEPRDLVVAIERSWWPALLEGDFTATVVDVDGSTLNPRPMRDPVLHSFIDAWEIAQGRSAPGHEGRYTELAGLPATDSTAAIESVGTLGLVADLSGWSYADQEAGPEAPDISHESLVALTRGPRMVVEYYVAGHSTPYVRGAFIADDSLDDLLRRTEPKAHDAWRTTSNDGELDPRAAAVADHLIKKIRQTVNNHRTKLKPPTPPPEDVTLPFFNEVMRRVMSGIGKGVRQPIPDTRPISIRLEHAPREAESGLIEFAGTATYGLSDHYAGDEALVRLSISYRFLEDDRVGEHAALEIVPEDGFTEKSKGVFEGVLERVSEAQFRFVSAAYDPKWSGRLFVNGEVLGDLEDGR